MHLIVDRCKDSGARLSGSNEIECKSIGDKSISHRAICFALITPGTTKIENINTGRAVTVLIDELAKNGVRIEWVDRSTVIVGSMVDYLEFFRQQDLYFNLEGSSAAARFLIGVLVGLGVPATVDGSEILRNRPFDWIVDPLRILGAKLEYLGRERGLPLKLSRSTLHSGQVKMGVGSAQAVTSVLLAAMAGNVGVQIVRQATSRDHTERMAKSIGYHVSCDDDVVSYKPQSGLKFPKYRVSGDPSAIVYPLTSVLLHYRYGGDLPTYVWRDVCLNPTRTGFIELLKDVGAPITFANENLVGGEPRGDIVARGRFSLAPSLVLGNSQFHSMIDEIPLASAVAGTLAGASRLSGLHELTFKETDRIETSASLAAQFGADVRIDDDAILISGRTSPLNESLELSGYRDHRVIMAAAAVAAGIGCGARINDGEFFETSNPDFIEAMSSAGFSLRLI